MEERPSSEYQLLRKEYEILNRKYLRSRIELLDARLKNEERYHSCEFYCLGSTARRENVSNSDLDLLCVCNGFQVNNASWNRVSSELNVDKFMEQYGVVLYGTFYSIFHSFMQFYMVYGLPRTFLGSLLDSIPVTQERNQFLQHLNITHFERVFSQTLEDIDYYTKTGRIIIQENFSLQQLVERQELQKVVKSEFYRTATMFPRDLFFYIYCKNGKNGHYFHSTLVRLEVLESSEILSEVDKNIVIGTFKEVFYLCQLSRRGELSDLVVIEHLTSYRPQLTCCLEIMKKLK